MGSYLKISTNLLTPHFLLELKPSLYAEELLKYCAEELGQVFKGPQTQPQHTGLYSKWITTVLEHRLTELV